MIGAPVLDFTNQWRTLREILGGGGGEIFNMYAFGVGLRYANLSNIMLVQYMLYQIHCLIYYCNVTIALYAYILVFPFPCS